MNGEDNKCCRSLHKNDHRGGENGHEKPCKNRKGNWPPT